MSYGTRIAHTWTFVTETRINHVNTIMKTQCHDKLTIISGLSKQIHLGLKLTSLQILQQSFSPKRGPSRCIICIFKTTVIIIINIIVITLTYLDCCECHHYLQSFKRCYSTTRRYIRDLSLHFLLPCLVLQLPESDLTLIYH